VDESTKKLLYVYLAILLFTPVMGTGLYPWAIGGFVVSSLIFGIFEIVASRKTGAIFALLLALGTMAVGIFTIELGHTAVAMTQPDVNFKSITVTMFSVGGGTAIADTGTTVIEFDDNLLNDPSSNIREQLCWTVLGGGIAISLLAALFWFVPSGQFSPLVWSIMLFYHNFPVAIQNDTTMAISEGWMSPVVGWLSFFILFVPVIIGAVVSFRRGDSLVFTD